MVAWIGAVQVRFSVLVLKVTALAPYPVPLVEYLTFAGVKIWTAWPETAVAVAARQTAAKPCTKAELFIVCKPLFRFWRSGLIACRSATLTGHTRMWRKLFFGPWGRAC